MGRSCLALCTSAWASWCAVPLAGTGPAVSVHLGAGALIG